MAPPRVAVGLYAAEYNADTAAGDPPGKGQGPRSLGLATGARRWRRGFAARPVRASALGETPLDAVYQGGECFVELTLQEWTPAALAVLWPFSADFGEIGPVGRLLGDYAGTLTLTAEPNSPAAGFGPRKLVFRRAILAPEQRVEIPLGPVERETPALFRCFPYLKENGRWAWFEELE